MKKLLLPILGLFFALAAQAADQTVRTPVTDSGGQTSGFVDKKMKDMGDGTFAEVISTTVGGTGTSASNVQGAVADGAGVSTIKPVLIGGQDGTNVQSLATDTSGNVIVVGATAAAGGVATNPVRIAGSDGSNTRNIVTDVSGYLQVNGSAASGATDSGNPVKVGGKYNATRPTLVDGQRGDLQVNSRGDLSVEIGANQQSGADGQSNSAMAFLNNISHAGALLLVNAPHSFNETSWDRQRNNTSAVVLASASRTTTQTQADQTNYNARGIKVMVSTTVIGTGSITVSIQAKDANGIYYTLLTGAAIVTNTTNVYSIYPGLPATANVSANDVLPRNYRIVVTANNANAATYSVGSELIL